MVSKDEHLKIVRASFSGVKILEHPKIENDESLTNFDRRVFNMGKFINEANIQEQSEQIAGLKTAIDEVKSAGMMNKAARAEDALDKVFTVINVIAENQQRAIAEIEDIRTNGLQNP